MISPHRTIERPDDRYAEIGATVAALVAPTANDDPIRAAVGRELVRILAEGSQSLVGDLRRELAAVIDACAALDRLSGAKFLFSIGGLSHQRVELERSRDSLSRMLATLESLNGAENKQTSPPVPLPLILPLVEPRLLEESSNDPPEIAESVADAASLFEQAEASRRQEDFVAAEALYTEVLSVDPEFLPAYARRGSVALLLGHDLQALDDLTRALDDQPGDALLLTLRGDAHALGKRYDSALADYDQALACRPGLFRPRFNRAVVLRLRGDWHDARDEFSLILEALPGHAASHFNRGLIDEALGDTQSALAEYEAALQSDPEMAEAQRHRDDLKRRLEQTITTLETAAAPVPGRPAHLPLKRGRVTVGCPHCGETGAVQWNRLGQVFHCRKCSQCFGIKSGGTAVRLKKDKGGHWIDPTAPRAVPNRTRRRWVGWAAALLATAVVLGGAVRAAMRPAPVHAVEIELPRDLPGRAELFTRGWLRGDVPLMRRATNPANDKALYSWYTRHRAPALAVGTAPDAARVRVEVVSSKPHLNVLRVTISGVPFAGGQPAVELTQQWEERGDDWYFLPPPR